LGCSGLHPRRVEGGNGGFLGPVQEQYIPGGEGAEIDDVAHRAEGGLLGVNAIPCEIPDWIEGLESCLPQDDMNLVHGSNLLFSLSLSLPLYHTGRFLSIP